MESTRSLVDRYIVGLAPSKSMLYPTVVLVCKSFDYRILQRGTEDMSFAADRERRQTAGNRLKRLLEQQDDQEDEFYGTAYGGFVDVGAIRCLLLWLSSCVESLCLARRRQRLRIGRVRGRRGRF